MDDKQRKEWVEKAEKNMLPELRKAQMEREQTKETTKVNVKAKTKK